MRRVYLVEHQGWLNPEVWTVDRIFFNKKKAIKACELHNQREKDARLSVHDGKGSVEYYYFRY